MARYYRKALKYDNLIACYRLNEERGTEVRDYSKNEYTGTSSSLMRSWTDRRVLGPDGTKCAKFDGSASYVNIYAAQPSQPTTEGTVCIWAAAYDEFLGGTTAGRLIHLAADGDNQIIINFNTTANQFVGIYKAGGTSKSVTSDLVYNVGYGPQFHHFALTWSATNDEVKFFIDGVQQGSTLDSLGSWSGDMASNLMAIGSAATDTPANVWDGFLDSCFIYGAAIDADKILELSRIS